MPKGIGYAKPRPKPPAMPPARFKDMPKEKSKSSKEFPRKSKQKPHL